MMDATTDRTIGDRTWRSLFDKYDWKAVVVDTLWEVAECEDSTPESRILALSYLNRAANAGVMLAFDKAALPEFTVEVLTSTALGPPTVRWFGRRRRARVAALMASRLLGVKYLLETAVQYLPHVDSETSSLPRTEMGKETYS